MAHNEWKNERNHDFINRLPDDCLILIFEYLPIVDRFRAAGVSERWDYLVSLSWCSIKNFSFNKMGWEHVFWRSFGGVKNFDDRIFKGFLSRFGKFLRSVELCCYEPIYIEYALTLDSLRNIIIYCTRLRTLLLGQMTMIDSKCEGKTFDADDCQCQPHLLEVIEELKNWSYISKLKRFGINMGHIKTNDFSSLLPKMKSLETLFISFEISLHVENSYLCQLPQSLRQVCFENCQSIDEYHIIDAIKDLENLETLVLLQIRGYKLLHHLTSKQKKYLKNFVYESYIIDEFDLDVDLTREIHIFQSFTNLEILNLNGNSSLVNDRLLEILSKHCKKLIFLDISCNFDYVTDTGLQHITNLPKLKYLHIYRMEMITGSLLKRMESLEVIDCHLCEDLEDGGLCALIKDSKLKFINAQYCCNITNKFLEAVIEEINSRETKSIVTLVVEDTKINTQDFELPSLLRIVDSDSYRAPYDDPLNDMNFYIPTL